MTYTEKKYWNTRYRTQGNSGVGSYGEEVKWKVNLVTQYAQDLNIKTLLDIGCGDFNFGRNLINRHQFVNYEAIDIADHIITRHQQTKLAEQINFKVCDFSNLPSPQLTHLKSEMSICMDVVFHLSNQRNHDNLLHNFLSSFTKVGMLCSWNKDIIKLYKGKFANHTFYRPTIFNKNEEIYQKFNHKIIKVPSCKEKDIHILTLKNI